MQFDQLNRREFVTLLGGAAATCPLAARAQQSDGGVRRIGFLGSATAVGSTKAIDALRTGLREFGYVEGRNIVIEFRWAEQRYDRLPQLVRELIATQVDLLITHGTPGTRAAKQATSTIPIVMAISGDAVATGLVSSLARPETNVTGSTFFLPELNAKRLEVLKEACPSISHPTARFACMLLARAARSTKPNRGAVAVISSTVCSKPASTKACLISRAPHYL
jgi:putative tryptophan/tyrosine transport system substrate-binding protein